MRTVTGRWGAAALVASLAMLAVSCAGPAGSAEPTASASASPEAASPDVASPEAASPAMVPDASDAGAFQPPRPSCPAPALAATAPALTASAAGTSVAMLMGSSTVLTCSTAGSDDLIGADPTDALPVPSGGTVRVALPEGWRFLWWEGFDTDADDEGSNVLPGVETPERPQSIEIPAPVRSGDSVLGVSAWAISEDGRVVARIEGEALVRMP